MRLILAAVIAAFASRCPPWNGDFEPPTEILVAAANARGFEKAKADFVCAGTNDERIINAALARLVYGGTLRLADGDYSIDGFEQEGDSAICLGYNEGLTRVITIRGTTESKIYGEARGAILHVTKRAMDAMETNRTYRVFYGAGRIPEGPGNTYSYTHVNNVNFINLIIRFHDASKPLIGIDGRHFGSMELDLVGIYTERYFPDRTARDSFRRRPSRCWPRSASGCPRTARRSTGRVARELRRTPTALRPRRRRRMARFSQSQSRRENILL